MSTDLALREKQDGLVQAIRADVFKEQVASVLPPSVTLDRFVRIAHTAVMTNPSIAQIPNQPTILRALVQCAAVGLMPDGVEAAIVKRGTDAVFTPMVGGFRKIAADYGWLLRGRVVYSNDTFEYTDEPPAITHHPARIDQERGELIAAYAVAEHRDGRRMQLVMRKEDIVARRELATTKAVWDKWTAEMWTKTPERALFKRIPLAESDTERARIERMIAAADLPERPAESLYGHRRDELPVLPAADSAGPVGSTTAGPRPAEQPAEPSQQADDAAQQRESVSGAASAAPGPAVDDEPQVGEAAVATPPDDALAVEAAASVASTFEIPNGKNRGKTLAEVHASGDDGRSWLGWALKKIGWPSPENEAEQFFRDAVWAFCRKHEPGLYQAALAAKQAEGLL